MTELTLATDKLKYDKGELITATYSWTDFPENTPDQTVTVPVDGAAVLDGTRIQAVISGPLTITTHGHVVEVEILVPTIDGVPMQPTDDPLVWTATA